MGEDRTNFSGTGVALITPFNSDMQIDFPALEKLVDNMIVKGVDYLVVMGSTGETPTLTCSEKDEVLACVLKTNAGRVPIMLGIGGNCTSETISAINKADYHGVSAILSVVPYYNKPTQRGVYEHFAAIAAVSPVPVMMYNIPGRTGINMNAETTLELAHNFPIFCGVKEASANLSQMVAILKDSPEHFVTVSGDDGFILPLVACGGHGVISVAANAYPEEIGQLTRAALNGDMATAQSINFDFANLFKYLFVEGNPSGIKALLDIKGMCKNYLRLPLVSVSNETFLLLEEEVKKIG
jgi:4-hydroxy-tetrahydrodipicolinate synthase